MSQLTEQVTWRYLETVLGKEGARKELARQLRLAADIVEQKGYPDVFGCELMFEKDTNKFTEEKPFVATLSVILSYPWPG